MVLVNSKRCRYVRRRLGAVRRVIRSLGLSPRPARMDRRSASCSCHTSSAIAASIADPDENRATLAAAPTRAAWAATGSPRCWRADCPTSALVSADKSDRSASVRVSSVSCQAPTTRSMAVSARSTTLQAPPLADDDRPEDQHGRDHQRGDDGQCDDRARCASGGRPRSPAAPARDRSFPRWSGHWSVEEQWSTWSTSRGSRSEGFRWPSVSGPPPPTPARTPEPRPTSRPPHRSAWSGHGGRGHRS